MFRNLFCENSVLGGIFIRLFGTLEYVVKHKKSVTPAPSYFSYFIYNTQDV